MGLRKSISSFASSVGAFINSKFPALSKVLIHKHSLLEHGEENHARILPTQAELSTNGTHFSSTTAERPRLFALLIGINTYNPSSTSTSESRASAMIPRSSDSPDEPPDFANLRGAVADAEQFQDYLLRDLLVPPSHVRFLKDEEATRENIIAAFQTIATDTNIQKGDSIFIFYAGHGAQAYPPERLRNNPSRPERVELLIPSDFSKDPSNTRYMGIPDYTLATLLNNIAKNKGDNITIVFDCCHSASALRGGVKARLNDEEEIVRSGPELDYQVPDELDEDIWGTMERGLAAPVALRHLGASSYVFLAACTSAQMAKEKSSRGYFTTALLEYLKTNPQSALKTACSDVITALNIVGQDPQCEGVQSSRRPIFHNYTPPYGKRFFDFCAGPKPKNGLKPSLVLKGGEAHGLVAKDELVVYENKLKTEEQAIGTVVLTKISIDTSTFVFTPRLAGTTLSRYPQAVAIFHQSAINTPQFLAVYVDPTNPELTSRVKRLGGSVIVDCVDKAHIHISAMPSEKQLRFKVVDAALSGVDLKPHFIQDTDEDLTHVLRGLSHYYHHLKRSSKTLPTDKISVSLFRVKDNGYGHPRVVRADDSKNLISEVTHTAEIICEDEEAMYGLEIKNDSDKEEKLYPVLLYFDNVDFTITRNFPHTVTLGRQADSPWPAKGRSMTIGYGVGPGSSIHPFSFYVSQGNDVEAGFFKLFLFQTPVDLQNVEQDNSLFVKTRGMKPVPLPSSNQSISQWGEITFPVIQRRTQK